MSELMREALRRYQQPQPLNVDIRELVRQSAPAPKALEAVRADARSKGTHTLSDLEIDREVAAVRSQAKKSQQTAQPMKVVIDTNVVVSAILNEDGLPAAVLNLAVKRIVRMFVSAEIPTEYEAVLRRPRLKIDASLVGRRKSHCRWNTSSSASMPSSGRRPSSASKNGAISRCHRSLTSRPAMPFRAAWKSGVSR